MFWKIGQNKPDRPDSKHIELAVSIKLGWDMYILFKKYIYGHIKKSKIPS
jgi:hypothetical protein